MSRSTSNRSGKSPPPAHCRKGIPIYLRASYCGRGVTGSVWEFWRLKRLLIGF
jgi:hypothetical protein